MSEMSSFYGGRKGASFVIVKRFDGIDIPQPGDGSGTTEYTYTMDYYAVDSASNQFLFADSADIVGAVPVTDGSSTKYIIKQVSENLQKYTWTRKNNDGSAINGTNFVLPKALAQGMVQCFAKGAASASEVNYGEYVIIDTFENLHDRNNLDNGKVYRRGMDLTTELAGAEYIGQIMGPQGECPELGIDKFKTVSETTGAHQGTYTADADDIIPGAYITKGGGRAYNDYISYSWVTIRDSYNNVEGCLIGFKIPTLVEEYEARSMSPYEQRAKDSKGKYYNYDLISEDPEQYIDNKWQHPYYQKWQIKVPHGYHGVNSTNIEVVPTKTRPAYDATEEEEDFKGATLYKDAALTKVFMVATESLDVLRDAEYNADESILYALVEYNETQYYVKKSECYKYILRYRETNFDNLEEGEVTYYEIGEVNSIRKVTVSENGVMTVFYTSKDPEIIDYAIQWIDNTGDTESIEISEEGTVTVWYNTLDEKGNHKKTVFDKKIDWIDSITLSQEGEFKLIYNNDSIENLPIDPDTKHSVYKNILTWVDNVSLADDGTVTVQYNTVDEKGNKNKTVYDKELDWITSATLSQEGDFKLVYNNDSVRGLPKDPNTGNSMYENTLTWVESGELSQDGEFKLVYNNDSVEELPIDPDTGHSVFKREMKWLDNSGETDGVDVNEEGTVTFWYNTLNKDGEHKKTNFTKKIDWITSVTIDQEGKFKLIYNNDTLPSLPIDPESNHSMYENTLNWIDLVKVSDDGVIDFYYNSDHEKPIYSTTGDARIKSIKNITFDSTGGDEGKEGDGTQKFVVTYNIKDEEGKEIVEDNSNWAAMNYIIEAKVSEPSSAYPEAPYYHLLVIYSDPEYRKKFKDKWVSYPSEKFGEKYDEWIDMGNIRGEEGGYHNIVTLNTTDLLYDDSDSKIAIPPEYILYACNVRAGGNDYILEEGTGVDTTYAGWGCTVTTNDTSILYFYDYAVNNWIRVGDVSAAMNDPSLVIIKAKPDVATGAPPADEDTLRDNGFWLVLEDVTFAQ